MRTYLSSPIICCFQVDQKVVGLGFAGYSWYRFHEKSLWLFDGVSSFCLQNRLSISRMRPGNFLLVEGGGKINFYLWNVPVLRFVTVGCFGRGGDFVFVKDSERKILYLWKCCSVGSVCKNQFLFVGCARLSIRVGWTPWLRRWFCICERRGEK